MHLISLYIFHFIYFISYSVSSFWPKYFGEIGLGDGSIGLLMSLPAVVGVLIQPIWGTLTDRIRLKRYILVGLLAALTSVCFLMEGRASFGALMVGLALFSVLQLPVAPVYSTISLEYTRSVGRSYGPIRLVGTVGYQTGALLTGALLVGSLRGIFRLMGVIMLLSCMVAFFLPPVRGHQHGREKVSVRLLFRDRHMLALLALIFIGTITSQYYMTFFAKHLGDLGVSNAMTGLMLFVSVALELPFLFFADRFARMTNIWNWLLIGFGLNAVRWIGLSVSRTAPMILLYQLPAVSVMACFEYIPALYVNKKVPEALKGSAQNAVMIVSFGISRIVGSMLGGWISERVGIPMVFRFNGVLLLAAVALLYRPTRALIRSEGNVLAD